MYKKGILHRDISLNNVLLGKPGAKPGSRGALIDFDAATHLGAETPEDWIIVSCASAASICHDLKDIPRVPVFISQ